MIVTGLETRLFFKTLGPKPKSGGPNMYIYVWEVSKIRGSFATGPAGVSSPDVMMENMLNDSENNMAILLY